MIISLALVILSFIFIVYVGIIGLTVMWKVFNWVAKLTTLCFKWLLFGTVKKKERYY